MKIGFIGTGAISEAVVTGLLSSSNSPDAIVLSPRNAERAAALESRFRQVSIANHNQAVVDACDVVCLSIRPQVAHQVLEALEFHEGTTVVSFVATYTASILEGLVGPAIKIVRMIPLPPVADCLGPVVMFPSDGEVEKLFRGLGTIISAENEDQFHALWAATSLMAPYFGLLGSASKWLRDREVPPNQADTFVSSMFHSIAKTGLSIHGEGFDKISSDHSTAGGLNEQLSRELLHSGWFDQVSKGLSLIFERLNGRAGFDDTIQ